MSGFGDDEECPFFDAQEDIASSSSSNFDGNEMFDSNASSSSLVTHVSHYDVWVQSPASVKERRSKFLNWMDREVDRIMESSGAVLRNPGLRDEFCLLQSSTSHGPIHNMDMLEKFGSNMNFVCREGSSDCGTDGDVDELGQHRKTGECQEAEMAKEFMSSPSSEQLMQRETKETANLVGTVKRVKKGWLHRLWGIMDMQGEAKNQGVSIYNSIRGARVQRVRVHQCRKKSKELSALYLGQDIQAHDGSIISMKFSPDGQYLASAGQDGIVRLWKVVEDERSKEHDIPEIDPSCIYFAVNHLSEVTPFIVGKEKMGKVKSLRKTPDTACAIIPPKVFRILEKPLHEFQGHSGEILALSWSMNNYLLSSSVDKTVRLWRVGFDHCMKVFSHSNYVTCVQFNPVDDNYFISGSIDGKVRIWEIACCQVVDWTDIREIITAVCYRPNGQGGIVGSLAGICRFYTISDNCLQLDAQICLHSKKMSACKRITGFQFFPQDPNKVMVTCADSQVRILHGIHMIGKYKGLGNAGNQIYASFTPDGKHIVSASEDSNVYVLNCGTQDQLALSQARHIRSWERFSANASIAIPWCGLRCQDSKDGWNSIEGCSSACFSLKQEFFSESFVKGSATWPEEKLPASSLATLSTLPISHNKFLKTSCQSTSNSHAWGLVIVTAGCDGRIRSFQNYGLPIHV